MLLERLLTSAAWQHHHYIVSRLSFQPALPIGRFWR